MTKDRPPMFSITRSRDSAGHPSVNGLLSESPVEQVPPSPTETHPAGPARTVFLVLSARNQRDRCWSVLSREGGWVRVRRGEGPRGRSSGHVQLFWLPHLAHIPELRCPGAQWGCGTWDRGRVAAALVSSEAGPHVPCCWLRVLWGQGDRPPTAQRGIQSLWPVLATLAYLVFPHSIP